MTSFLHPWLMQSTAIWRLPHLCTWSHLRRDWTRLIPELYLRNEHCTVSLFSCILMSACHAAGLNTEVLYVCISCIYFVNTLLKRRSCCVRLSALYSARDKIKSQTHTPLTPTLVHLALSPAHGPNRGTSHPNTDSHHKPSLHSTKPWIVNSGESSHCSNRKGNILTCKLQPFSRNERKRSSASISSKWTHVTSDTLVPDYKYRSVKEKY